MNIAYVVKRYPVYSQTFIVNEILAHEAAGINTVIFSLHAPNDAHFQDSISRVRAPVVYLNGASGSSVKAADVWALLRDIDAKIPGAWQVLAAEHDADLGDLHRALLLAQACIKRGIDHLHAHFATSATSVARLAAQFAGITYSFTAHAKDIFTNEVEPADLQRNARDAAAVITVSDYNVAHVKHVCPGARVARIYNGLDLERFVFHSPAGRPHVILAVGRLVEKKGFADLIDACAVLAARGERFECRIAGGGEQHAALQAQITALGLHGYVRLLGELPQRAIFAEMQGAAVLAAPCVVASDNDMDGLPTVLTEALAQGTPCVATTVTGIPELIEHGVSGLLTPQHDPHALADALTRLLNDGALRERLARNGRARVETAFDAAHNTAALREIWHSSIERARALPSGQPDLVDRRNFLSPRQAGREEIPPHQLGWADRSAAEAA
jgi:colanic acid/amylovoran biosynthesis glycosyltransferase